MPVLAAFDTHSLIYTVAGVAALAGALVPRLARNRPITTPVVCLGIGLLVFSLPLPLNAPDPVAFPDWAEYITELGVIVSLMGAGLKLDRPIGWRTWSSTWRLLAITMPLTIAGTVLLGWWMVGLAPAAAMLLGAVLAPTDPVLASDVQVGPPGEGMQDSADPHDAEEEVRFALTSEAGLNDALAFPFTNAAVAMAIAGTDSSGWILDWVALDVAYKILAGLVVGLVVGRVLGWLVFRVGERMALARAGEGFVALAATFLSYGVAEDAGAYGFVAVFVTAVTLRHYEHEHEYHATLHDFAEQTERLLMIGLVILLGGAVAGGVLSELTIGGVVLATVFLLVLRPTAAWVALPRGLAWQDRAAISFFGIRGIGSLYYLAYALNAVSVPDARTLWALVAFVLLASIVLHGVTVTPVMNALDRRRAAPATAPSS